MSAVGQMLDTITSLEELEAFRRMVTNPPQNMKTKQPTQADNERMDRMRIEFIRRQK